MGVILTDVKLCNKAMIRLGVDQFDSFTDGTDAGAVCGETYPDLVKALLGMNDWRFATGKRQLARLTAAPVSEFKYAFQLPSDYIAGPFAVFINGDAGAPIFKDWKIFEDKLYTDVETIFINYRFKPSESKYRPWFTELAVLALAAAVAPTLTDSAKLAIEYNERAFGVPSDNYRGGWYSVASSLNEEESDDVVLQIDNDLIKERFS